jgi:two-component system phosphate regulon sensor histidine kinase PhoR
LILPQRWIWHLTLLAAWFAAAGLLGWLFGGVSWWLFAALAVYLVRTLVQLYELDRALHGGARRPQFETRGLWAEILARVEHQRAKARSRKKRYNRLLREVRESTSAISDAGIILNGEKEIQWFNPAATRLLGLSLTIDTGNRIDNLIRHPDFVRYLAAPTGEAISIPSPIDDEGRLAVQMVPYGHDQSLVIIRDVTREALLERARRDFVANASHEIRSPVTVIGGYLEALGEDQDLPARWQVPVQQMHIQAERMMRILRDLLELSRLESGEPRARRDFVDVVSLLKRIVGEFAPREKVPEVQLQIDTDVALLGNENELHSIFYNLISNAVRFTPHEGRVRVVWASGPNGAQFEVADTGIGIAPEHIPRITERFYRVDPGRSRANGGTGLGLAIVKHALQRHDASLSIESREGVGSTFRCVFPKARVATRADTAASPVI